MSRRMRFVTWALVAFLTLLPAIGAAQTLTWERLSDSPKMGGLGQSLVVAGDYVFILRAATTGDYQFFSYSIETGGWVYLPTPSQRPKNGTAMVWDGERHFYALLGAAYGDSGRRFFYRFDLDTHEWTRLQDTPLDQGAGTALAFAVSDRGPVLYARVGAATKQRSRAVTAFLLYDIAVGEWTNLGTLPAGWTCTDDGAALAWDGATGIYALRGCDCQDIPTRAFARYDITSGTWASLPPIPSPVNDGGSLVWDRGGYIYAIAGGGGEKGAMGRDLFRFSIVDQVWRDDLPELPVPVGEYNGNRLGFWKGGLIFWQGTPQTWDGGGTGLFVLVIAGSDLALPHDPPIVAAPTR